MNENLRGLYLYAPFVAVSMPMSVIKALIITNEREELKLTDILEVCFGEPLSTHRGVAGSRASGAANLAEGAEQEDGS